MNLIQRKLINRKSLLVEINSILKKENAKSKTAREAVLKILLESSKVGNEIIESNFKNGMQGTAHISYNAFLVDQLIRTIHQFAVLHVYRATNPTDSEKLVIVAVGGYGRSEMAPYSDIDLLFLRPYKLTVWAEQVIEYILYMLWDLGLKVSHSVRSIDECVRLSLKNISISTSLLDSRYICGEKNLFEELEKNFLNKVIKNTSKEFLSLKLKERDIRHKKMGDSRYLVEPNIKDGKGGLRDLQTLLWLGKYIYQIKNMKGLESQRILTLAEVNRFRKAENFLWTVRSWMHYLTNRAEERLTLDIQREIAGLLNYKARKNTSTVERFMKHYYLTAKEVGDLTRIFCSTIELKENKRNSKSLVKVKNFFRRNIGGFTEKDSRLFVDSKNFFSTYPIDMLRLFLVAQAYGYDIHPDTLALITRNLHRISKLRNNTEASKIFLSILTSTKSPDVFLRKMNESGVLGRFIPDFGKVVAQTQHDMYHIYTVDEHTIRAIGILHKIDSGALIEEQPLATKLIRNIVSKRSLYLAVFLHDIAKGRGGDHSKIGERIALDLCPRLGLDSYETKLVAWLVRWHLLMSHTAFKRDTADTKTILDFINVVSEEEHLQLLLILTIVDIKAVGPGVWNAWKGQLLRSLYEASISALSGSYDFSRNKRLVEAKLNLRELLSDWSDQAFITYTELVYDQYWFSQDSFIQERQARFVNKVINSENKFHIELHIDNFNAVTEVTIYTQDHPGLFSRLSGAIALSGGSVVDARLNTLKNGMVIDTFWIQNYDRLPFADKIEIEILKNNLFQSITNENWIKEKFIKKDNAQLETIQFNQSKVRVIIDNHASNIHTVIEVQAFDKIGLLYELTHIISEIGLQISSSHITTYGEIAVDVFYVKDLFGLKITNLSKINSIKTILYNYLKEKNKSKQLMYSSNFKA